MSLNQAQIAQLPKVELHLHLDCCLSLEAVQRLQPGISEEEYMQRFIPPPKCTDLDDILRYASATVALLQTEEGLREAVGDLFDQLQQDNVIYAEMRFAPLLHLEQGLVAEEVVEIVSESVAQNSRSTGILCGILLCTLRPWEEAQSLQTVKLVDRYARDTHVAGFDIAANEAGFPSAPHQKAFEYAIEREIPRTAHAGEASGPESVWETLAACKPQRIGHGVRSVEDDELIEYLIENDIHLEICPTSNVMTDAYAEYADHPIDRLLRSGVSVGINSDARTLIPITLTEEYVKLVETFGWGAEEFHQCNVNALSHAFIENSARETLGKTLARGYDSAGMGGATGR